MTFLRHASRHVHYSVANWIETQLGELDWTTTDEVPFGAAKVTVQKVAAIVGDKLDNKIEPGIVAITLGTETNPVPEELGGPLHAQDYPIFVDVFQATDAAALALACDVRDIVLGRLPGTRRSIPVIDQVTGTPVAGWVLEFDDVERVRPEHSWPIHWHSVHLTAVAHYQEVTY